MSQTNIWLRLQRFADGGTAGAAGAGTGEGAQAATGVNPDDAGRARLLELGVPESKISKRAQREVGRRMDASRGTAAQQDAAAKNDPPTGTEEATKAKPSRMSWDEIKADPEYNAEIQRAMQARVKKARGAEEAMAQMAGALEVLARKYGMDASKLDYAALSKAIEDDDTLDARFYEDMANRTGMTPEAARVVDRQQRELNRQKQIQEASARQMAAAQHIASLEQQAAQFRQTVPTFDLKEALRDERFARAVGPGGGLTVEQAYNAFHYREIQAAQNEITARRIREEMSKSVQANRARPQELGSNGTAPSVTSIDWSKATKEQLAEMNARVRREGRVYR